MALVPESNKSFGVVHKSKSIQEAIFSSITKCCELERRNSMWESIFLSGGTALTPGLKARFEREANKLQCISETIGDSQSKELGFLMLPNYLQTYCNRPHHTSFLGGAIVAKIVYAGGSGVGGGYVGKAEYREYGPACVQMK